MQRNTLIFIALTFSAGVYAASSDVNMNLVTPQGIGQSIGEVKITETNTGLEFAPSLKALPAGQHGFHVHAIGSCEPGMKDGKASAAEAAGGHFDPGHTNSHQGPDGMGHRGDLPVLVVSDDGNATQSVIAPRLTRLDEIRGKALMIHVGGDNMSDKPKPLGGGGARYACGIIK